MVSLPNGGTTMCHQALRSLFPGAPAHVSPWLLPGAGWGAPPHSGPSLGASVFVLVTGSDIANASVTNTPDPRAL